RFGTAAEFTPASQQFRQEVSSAFTHNDGLGEGKIQLVECAAGGLVQAYIAGTWYQFRDGKWQANPATTARSEGQFTFPDLKGQAIKVSLPWKSIRQLIRFGPTNFLATDENLFAVVNGQPSSLGWTGRVN